MKKKICFVGQPEYFRCLYEKDLDDEFEVIEYQLNMTSDKVEARNRQTPLLRIECDIMFFFRGEFILDDILERVKKNCICVQLSSEPIPNSLIDKYAESTHPILLRDRADRNNRFNMLKLNRNKFHKFYHHDKTSIPYLEKNGFKVDGEFIFPVATGLYRPILEQQKEYDIGFFGRSTEWREMQLGIPKRDLDVLHVVHGVIGEKFVKMINSCRIGINIHVHGLPSLEHRCQNMISCGTFVLSEPLTHNDCLKKGEHFIEIDTKKPNDCIDKIKYYLEHGAERRMIANQGMEFVRKELNSVKCFKKLVGECLK